MGVGHRTEAAVDMAVFSIAVVPLIVAGVAVGVMGLGMRATLLAVERLLDEPGAKPS